MPRIFLRSTVAAFSTADKNSGEFRSADLMSGGKLKLKRTSPTPLKREGETRQVLRLIVDSSLFDGMLVEARPEEKKLHNGKIWP